MYEYVVKGIEIAQYSIITLMTAVGILLFLPFKIKKRYLPARITATVLLCLAGNFLAFSGVLAHLVGTEWRSPCIFISWFAAAFVLYDHDPRRILVVCAEIICLQSGMTGTIFVIQSFGMSSVGLIIWQACINVCVYAVWYLRFMKQFREDTMQEIPLSKGFLRYSLISLSLCLLLSLSFFITNINFSAIFFCAYFIFGAYILYFFYQKDNAEYKLHVQEMIERERVSQQKIRQRNIDSINQKCHDLKHSLEALKTMQATDTQEYITEIEEAIRFYDSIMDSGNSKLDVILSEKKLLCDYYHISFTRMVEAQALDFMNIVDLYTLFGNAFDNAIDACSKEEEGQRIISLRIFKEGEFLNIIMENSCSTPPMIRDGLPITQKEDTVYHGFGMKSMQSVVGKYQGRMCFEYFEGRCVLSIFFQLNT